jgi:uncharacterized protein (DUF2141 family)
VPVAFAVEPIAFGRQEVMSKVRIGAAALALGALVALPAAGIAVPAEPAQHACPADQPAMLVRVTGFKARTGIVRVQSYGGDPDNYFDKGTYLKRVEAPVPASGPLDVCMPVSAPGRYAISVRHDVNGSGKTDSSDGGGMSGNPHLSLLAIMLKHKPDPAQVSVEVGHGVKMVPVTLNYVQGGSFRPVAG